MPVVPSCLLESIWVEFHAAIGRDRPEFHPDHPLGCHRRRIPDRALGPHPGRGVDTGGAIPDGVTVHLAAAYDNAPSRAVLEVLGFGEELSRKGVPAPIQTGKRWVVERTNSWMNGYGKIRRCTDRDGRIVDLYLSAVFVTVRQFIQRARKRYRWGARPTTRRLKLTPIAGRPK
ncbi:hypothetical protein ACQPYK_18795 [Streptosporangium sp. CA-135522]|uniref:hypothetical protein n=1 Tax=Streptosporangium sp. CA-135522 TaxID=3240072 RepID=UPI003D91025B